MTVRSPSAVQLFWRRLSLRNKLIVIFASMMFVLLIFAITAANSTLRYQQEFQKALQTHYRINNFLTELQNHSALITAFTKSEDVTVIMLQESHKNMQAVLAEIIKESNVSQQALFEMTALENGLAVYIEKTYRIVTEKWAGINFYPGYYSALKIRDYMNTYLSNLQNILLMEGREQYALLARRSETVQDILTAAVIAVVILALRFVFVFSRRFTDPIREVAELSRRIAGGELDVPLMKQSEMYADEISILADSFNRMSRNIKMMVDDITQKSLREKRWHESELERESALASLREAQLISLQSQIKPHFLFNTLNTITRQAELENAQQTVSLIQSLARLLRYNLVSHQQAVPLDQELLAVNEYINLQKKRFGSRIEYRCQCSIEASQVLFPPLVVQTFVENAVCHGIEPLIDGGLVLVDIRHRGNRFLIRILDNGVGMNSQKRDTLYAPFKQSKLDAMDGSVHGIGIRNVLTRLNLYYRGREKTKVYSKEGKGTLVVISIPVEKER